MRSHRKGYYQDRTLKKNIEKDQIKKLWTRRSVITSSMIDKNIEVYNGRQFISVKVSKSMLGHKLGEFSFTRKIYQYKKGKKK